MFFTTIVKQTIQLAQAARQARRQRQQEQESTGPDKPMPPSAEEKALEDFLRSLPPPVVGMMTSVMYAGRPDFFEIDFAEKCKFVFKHLPHPERAIRRLLRTAKLSRLLEKGLTRMAKAGFNLDEKMAGKFC